MKKIFISFLILISSLSSYCQVGVFNSVKTKALNVKGISAQNNAADSLLVVDAVSGKVGYINKNRIGGGGYTPTLQQVLTAGSVLTDTNTIDLGSNYVRFKLNDNNSKVIIGPGNTLGAAFTVNRNLAGVSGMSVGIQVTNTSSGTGNTSNYGIRLLSNSTTSGGYCTNFGMYIQTVSGNTNYALYVPPTGGQVGIGTFIDNTDALFAVGGSVRIAGSTKIQSLSNSTDITDSMVVANSSGILAKRIIPILNPAGSNRELQYNNSGVLAGTSGVEYGYTNNRLLIKALGASDTALKIFQLGASDNGILMKASDPNSPYSPRIVFMSSRINNSAKIGLEYNSLNIQGKVNEYGAANTSMITFGSFGSGKFPFQIHDYPFSTPSGTDSWATKVTTQSTTTIGSAIDWGQTGQLSDLLQFRNNSLTTLSRFNKNGWLGVGADSARSYIDANGSFGANIRVYEEDFTITLDETDHTVIFQNDASIVYWPAASSANVRRIYVIVNRSNAAITSSSYMSFSGTATSIPSKSSVWIQSDGYSWYQTK